MREQEREKEDRVGGGSITTAGGATECHAVRLHSTLLARHDTTRRGLFTITAFSHGNHRARRAFHGYNEMYMMVLNKCSKTWTIYMFLERMMTTQL